MKISKFTTRAAALVCASVIASAAAQAQSVAGSEGSGETPRSLEQAPDLSKRRIVDRAPKLEEGSDRSVRPPTAEELERAFTTVVRSRDGSTREAAPDSAVRDGMARQIGVGVHDIADSYEIEIARGHPDHQVVLPDNA